MFLADDIVLSPFKGLLMIFREIHKAAIDEIAGEAQAIRDELATLYRSLEESAISEEEFDEREGRLLDRLDAVDDRGGSLEMDEDEDEEDEEYEDGEDDEDEEDDDEEEDEGPAVWESAGYDEPSGESGEKSGADPDEEGGGALE